MLNTTVLLTKNQVKLQPVCCHCGRFRDENGTWYDAEIDAKSADILLTHGICPECTMKHYGEFFSSKEEVAETS